MTDTESQQWALHHLVSYWQRRPQASDTLEGIVRWWLPQDGRPGMAAVAQALALLVARGVVQMAPAADGRVRYRLREPAKGALGGLL